MADYAMIIDYKYCTNCHTCDVSCRQELFGRLGHEISQDEWGIKVVEFGPEQLQGKWMWNYLPVPSDLCDLCIDRLGEGKKPACELHCLSNCIHVVPLEEAVKTMAEKGNTVACFIP